MTEINLVKLPESPEFLNNAVSPASREIGNTLGNIFYAIFSPINYNAEKLRIKLSENLKKYQNDIENELNKIPEEKLIDPPLSLVGPAIEASKFYIDEEEMRKMFAKLIASSMNIDTSTKAHHSFVEIIKQLNPLDAANIQIIFQNKSRLPMAQYYAIADQGNYIFHTNVFLSNPQNTDINAQASSITNLNRLGLVSLDYDLHLSNDAIYNIFRNEPTYLALKNQIEESIQKNSTYEFKSIEIHKYIVEITPFGNDFVEICI